MQEGRQHAYYTQSVEDVRAALREDASRFADSLTHHLVSVGTITQEQAAGMGAR